MPMQWTMHMVHYCRCESCLAKQRKDDRAWFRVVERREDVVDRRGVLDLGDTGGLLLEDGTHLQDVTLRATMSQSRSSLHHGGIINLSGRGGRGAKLTRVTVVLTVPRGWRASGAPVCVVLANSTEVEAVDCTIRVEGDPGLALKSRGFLVSDGGGLRATGCTVQGCFHAFSCYDARSSLDAVRCAASDCDAGFLAASGGEVSAGEGCVVERANTGFLAMDGGKLKAGGGCRALGCDGSGFYVGLLSDMRVGEGCVATSQQARGMLESIQGAFTCTGGKMEVGPRCEADGFNIGFWAACGGRLDVGPGCRARGGSGGATNGAPGTRTIGFVAGSGGTLRAGRGCEAHGLVCGFVSCKGGAPGRPARLEAGDGCAAVRCVGGFFCGQGGRMELGVSGRAEGCRIGYLALGDDALLSAAAKCAALECARAGFVAVGSGRIEAGPSCKAKVEEGALACFGVYDAGVIDKCV